MLTTTTRLARATATTLLRSRLTRALAFPHDVDRYLELVDPLWAHGEIRARLLARDVETDDCVTLTLAPNGRWPGIAAGQHVQVGVEIDGLRHTRCFTVSSSAHRADGCITLTVKAQPDGRVSRHLVDAAQPGSVVTLSAPAGQFVLPDERPRRLLLITGGSGITPAMAMLRTLIDEGHDGEVVFIHYARRYDDLIFGEELAGAAARYPWLRLVRVITGEAPRGDDLGDRFSAEQLAEVLPHWRDYAAYACGPAPLIEAVQTHWREQAPAQTLHVEFFQPPRSTGPASGGRVAFAGSDLAVTDNGASLLEQAEAAGLKPEYGCRMGICHSCTCRKTTGRVKNIISGRESGDGDEEIQPCVSVPVGDVTLML